MSVIINESFNSLDFVVLKFLLSSEAEKSEYSRPDLTIKIKCVYVNDPFRSWIFMIYCFDFDIFWGQPSYQFQMLNLQFSVFGDLKGVNNSHVNDISLEISFYIKLELWRDWVAFKFAHIYITLAPIKNVSILWIKAFFFFGGGVWTSDARLYVSLLALICVRYWILYVK